MHSADIFSTLGRQGSTSNEKKAVPMCGYCFKKHLLLLTNSQWVIQTMPTKAADVQLLSALTYEPGSGGMFIIQL